MQWNNLALAQECELLVCHKCTYGAGFIVYLLQTEIILSGTIKTRLFFILPSLAVSGSHHPWAPVSIRSQNDNVALLLQQWDLGNSHPGGCKKHQELRNLRTTNGRNGAHFLKLVACLNLRQASRITCFFPTAQQLLNEQIFSSAT